LRLHPAIRRDDGAKSAELGKRAKKLIVAVTAGRRNVAAHRERINQIVIEIWFLKRRTRGFCNSARRRLLSVAGENTAFCSRHRGGFDAQPIFGGRRESTIPPYTAPAQMIVQVQLLWAFAKRKLRSCSGLARAVCRFTRRVPQAA